MRRPLRGFVTVLTTASLFLAGPALAQAAGPLHSRASAAGSLAATAVPEARNYGEMVYDPIHKNVLLLGGQDASSQGVPSVWAFDPRKGVWSYVAAYAPKGAIDGAAFDVAAGKVIVHVSWLLYTTSQVVSETWSFDPVTGAWENLKPKQSPPKGLCGCGAQMMVYDDKAGKIIMFGGIDITALFRCVNKGCDNAGWLAVETNDTWVFDYAGNLWTKMGRPADESQLPSPRNSNGLTYDVRADRVILFGGGGVFGPATDTWAYDYSSNTWTNLQPKVSPPGREYGYLAYDEGANKTVLFGGIGYDFNSEWLLPAETWTYDLSANSWTLESPLASPSARAWQAMAYSAKGDAVVMFGGGPDREHPTNETWLYETAAARWTQVT